MRYLLIQLRDDNDPMADHEVGCFARHLQCTPHAIDRWSLLDGPAPRDRFDIVDAAIIGGSGDYSVVRGGDWMDGAMATMHHIVASTMPTFASCWGFQALSKACGGTVEHLPERGHIGTHELHCEPACTDDPVFGVLGDTFTTQFGHEDVVTTAPPCARVLVRSSHGDCMAWKLQDAPIWGTQFHPELSHADLLDRLRRYPKYVRDVAGMDIDTFAATRVQPSDAAEQLLPAFAATVSASTT